MTKRKALWLGFGAIIIIGVSVAGYLVINSSSEGVITASKAAPATASPDKRIAITNRYASFSYPSSFTRLTSEKPVTPVLLSYNFVKRQFGSWQIAIQVTSLQTGSLSDDGTYNLRATQTARFEKAERKIGQHQAIIFSDHTSEVFAKVAYLKHANLDVSISVLGAAGSSNEDPEAVLEALVTGWQWH